MTKASLTKENIQLALSYTFRGLVHYPLAGSLVAGRPGAGEVAESYVEMQSQSLVVAHAFNPSIPGIEAGRSRVQA